MTFPIDWKDRELEFAAEQPLALMHITSDIQGLGGVFETLLPTISKEIAGDDFEWQYSTFAPLMYGRNLDVLEFLTERSERVRYRIDEITKMSSDELNSFEVAFICPGSVLATLLLNRKLCWGINLNICGWLGRKPQVPSYKFSGWKMRPLPPDVQIGFCTCNEAQEIEFFARSDADFSLLVSCEA